MLTYAHIHTYNRTQIHTHIIPRVTEELVLSVAEGAKNIRVPIGQGIAGTVAATGETINIVDAYSDSRFNSKYVYLYGCTYAYICVYGYIYSSRRFNMLC